MRNLSRKRTKLHGDISRVRDAVEGIAPKSTATETIAGLTAFHIIPFDGGRSGCEENHPTAPTLAWACATSPWISPLKPFQERPPFDGAGASGFLHGGSGVQPDSPRMGSG